MTITSNDIKLFQAQDNTDNDSGGGSRTSNEVVDGDVNNLFPDISRVDTVSGRVNLRKVFPAVMTDNRDVYYGAHAMVRKVPTDPKVSALIFHTDDPHDDRLGAQDKIENYVVASNLEQFYLFGNHVAGSRTITFLAQLTTKEPDVGEVYLLKESTIEQYVRLSAIETQEVIFVYGATQTNYTRKQIICTIEQPLEFAFAGSAFSPYGQTADTADTWATQVADAAKFYSTKELAEPALTGDLSIKVDSIFTQLVPASTQKTALVNKDAMIQGVGLLPTGDLLSETHSSSSGVPFSVDNAIVPNSITSMYQSQYKDDGLGNIIDTNSGDAIIGSVDYENGIITQSLLGGGITVKYEAALLFDSNIQFAGEIKITTGNVGNVFTRRLTSLPTVGDLYIDYRSQGKWYRFASTGNRTGTIETIGNDASIGSGNLYDNLDGSASVTMTLAALPDIDSSVIISWGSGGKLDDRAAYIENETSAILEFDLGQINIDPLTFVMQMWSAAHGTTFNITADANGDIIDSVGATYGLTGKLDSLEGKLSINAMSANANRIPTYNDATNPVIIDFNYATPAVDDDGEVKITTFSRGVEAGKTIFSAENTGAGTLLLELGESVLIDQVALTLTVTHALSTYFNQIKEEINLRSNATGQLLAKTGEMWGVVSPTGEINFSFPSRNVKSRSWASYIPTGTGTNYFLVSVKFEIHDVQDDILVSYQTSTAASAPNTHNITGEMQDIAKYKVQALQNITGEVRFNLNTSHPIHTKEGLVFDKNGKQLGTIDYDTGEIEYIYQNEADLNSVIKPTFTTIFTDSVGEEDYIYEYTFRTAATKLTASSFEMSYESANGSYIATSDVSGVITGTDVNDTESYVDTQTGMVHIVFTAPVKPASMKYTAVAESSLPLDPELLGLNPVRLPADGRVPVFKNGYMIIIFNEVLTAVVNGTPVANQVDTLARSGQAYIEVIDAEGKRLNSTAYVADRAAGTVTFEDPLVLEDKYGTPLTAPYSIVDRVEDMTMANDVQINGLITLSAPLTHDYSTGITKVASSLRFGDTGARVYNLFTQEIWNSGSPEWSDDLIGDDTTAKYNDLSYAIQIVNADSSAGRWAIIFRSTTTVDVVSEKLGVVQSNVSITISDVAPINPATGNPYFTMLKEGFGAGWVTNNVIRLNTESGDNNMWIIRTIEAGALSELTDSIDIETRGDAN